ncbi:PD-(D/E)XK motif protein [Rhodoplanes sp. Z2-YC6860]|uniref:PD-(D/E)XK motif protein n=1 Tax=Rhodoplanes sp. Z2-YC6860 TaxID=674703 RepID=UPI00078B4554|nr:PD-(D/E)XK motif protein [Rhodoplanes sp. Z2-YC6860]AMN44719.1 hypothetical protein RHPLAN_63100 [Rhodoplanes sp. Z2-YC6860]
MTATIEELWNALRAGASSAQRRVDASHPLDLYADFEPPSRPGLVLFCPVRPPEATSLRAISIERRQRSDESWSLRVSLEEPALLPVFKELCRDIIEATKQGVSPTAAGSAVLARIERWRSLMQAVPAGLSRSELRGLIGELLVLETFVIPQFGEAAAIKAWTGPLGTPQDFQLATGLRLEIKTLDYAGDRVTINGLRQLDAGGDPLQLGAVRVENTGLDAPGALTASRLIARLRAQLASAPAALQEFEALLRFSRWDDSVQSDQVSVRLKRIDWHTVDRNFPRLTSQTVPDGVTEATYVVNLPSLP